MRKARSRFCRPLVIALAAGSLTGAQEMDIQLPGEITITRAENPFRGFRDGGDGPPEVAAVAFTPGLEPVFGLEEFATGGEQWLAVDRAAGRLVVNAGLFSALVRRDATRLEPKQSLAIGTVRYRPLLDQPARLFLFLLKSQIVATYWHVEARIKTDTLLDDEHEALAVFSAVHVYYTNERNEEGYQFMLRLTKATGELSVSDFYP